MADLSLRWAHMPFCWLCHEAAHLFQVYITHRGCLVIVCCKVLLIQINELSAFVPF